MLHSRLVGIMQRELESQEFHLSPYCTQQIEQLIGNGVKRMRMNKADEHAGYVMQAERNLKSLVSYFRDYSQEIGDYPTLSNSNFDKALGSCPTLWPYCSSG